MPRDTLAETAEKTAHRLTLDAMWAPHVPPFEEMQPTDCRRHDGFIHQIHDMRSLLCFDPQDERFSLPVRTILWISFWMVHGKRKKKNCPPKNK
jgi:hypothetical protein